MVPFSHLPIDGTEIRGVLILPDCIGNRARVSKNQAWISIPMWFLRGESALLGISLNACPLEEKSPFLSFLGATKTKPYSFWTKKVWPDWCHSYLHSGGMEII